jgi:CxxC motif-containing protein (DUF1111 family)
VTNVNPVKRARRIELRRKHLGSDNPSCFYCDESDIACLELEHPVGREHDRAFTRVVCRNCHRKLELRRDVSKLTKNGQHRNPGTEPALHDYVLRVADDLNAVSESLRRWATLPDDRKKGVPESK